MANTKKMTKREMFEQIKANYNLTNEEVAFIDHELELLAKKNSAEKKPTAQQTANEGVRGYLLGAPVKVEDAITDDLIWIGDPKQVVGNMVQDIMVESDKDIKKHVITYSGYARFQCALLAPKAAAKLDVTP